jgi:hypothetical protein
MPPTTGREPRSRASTSSWRSFDPAAGEVDLFPQEITRALLNLISNGFYAATNSFSRKTVERSFFRQSGLAQAIDNDRWGRRLDSWRPPRLRADRCAVRDACREVRPSDLPRDWPIPYGLSESTRAYLVGGSRLDGRGVSFRGNPIL